MIKRPELNAPRLDVLRYERESVLPGYLFLAPWATEAVDVGPYIYDLDGNLVWAGTHALRGELVQNMHPCIYKSKSHVCMWEGRTKSSWGSGRGIIMNQHYEIVKMVELPESIGNLDMHEFNLVGGGKSVLFTSYTVEAADLSHLNLTQGIGFLLNSNFREMDMESEQILFTWSAAEHISFDGARTRSTRVNLERHSPFDLFHLNSVDKFTNGDFLISSRLLDCLYRISGKDGSIVWQMGGFGSDFRLDFPMARQHHARILTEFPNKTTSISIFNNGLENTPKNQSSGMIICVDEGRMTARLVVDFKSERGDMYTRTQGSVQVLPRSGHTLVSWGIYGDVTEHASDGRVLYNASIGHGLAQNYRAYKGSWKGLPLDNPSAWSYSRTNKSTTVVYASWNGATEVMRWRIHGRREFDQTYNFIAETPRSGFETNLTTPHFLQSVFVEAVSSEGASLANSSKIMTFVPSDALARYCDETRCPLSAVNSSAEDAAARSSAERQQRYTNRAHNLSHRKHLRRGKDILIYISAFYGVISICKVLRQRRSRRLHVNRQYGED